VLTLIPVSCGYLLELLNITLFLKKNPLNQKVNTWIKGQKKAVIFGLQFLSILELFVVCLLLYSYPKIAMGPVQTFVVCFGIILFELVLGTIASLAKIEAREFIQ